MKNSIIAKLEAEWISLNDKENAIRILSNCVMWEKLIAEYIQYWFFISVTDTPNYNQQLLLWTN